MITDSICAEGNMLTMRAIVVQQVNKAQKFGTNAVVVSNFYSLSLLCSHPVNT
jgi:hypothetical protein